MACSHLLVGLLTWGALIAAPAVAMAAPPWAPAEGWSGKNGPDADATDHHLPELGIEIGQCYREQLGLILGEQQGAAVAGALLGGVIGRSMDEVDQACIGQVLEQAATRKRVVWAGATGARYEVTPIQSFEDRRGRPCRQFITDATINGRHQSVYGTACREPDGSWRRAS